MKTKTRQNKASWKKKEQRQRKHQTKERQEHKQEQDEVQDTALLPVTIIQTKKRTEQNTGKTKARAIIVIIITTIYRNKNEWDRKVGHERKQNNYVL